MYEFCVFIIQSNDGLAFRLHNWVSMLNVSTHIDSSAMKYDDCPTQPCTATLVLVFTDVSKGCDLSNDSKYPQESGLWTGIHTYLGTYLIVIKEVTNKRRGKE